MLFVFDPIQLLAPGLLRGQTFPARNLRVAANRSKKYQTSGKTAY